MLESWMLTLSHPASSAASLSYIHWSIFFDFGLYVFILFIVLFLRWFVSRAGLRLSM